NRKSNPECDRRGIRSRPARHFPETASLDRQEYCGQARSLNNAGKTFGRASGTYGKGISMEDFDHKQVEQMIDYVLREIIRRPGVSISADSPLVSSGLIDSLALVNILQKLEDVTRMRIPAGKVQPKDMDTVTLMFGTAKRVGRPRK